MSQFIFLNLIVLLQQAGGGSPDVWWPSDVKTVFVRIERHDEWFSPPNRAPMSFFWRARNPLVLLVPHADRPYVFADGACFGVVANHQWCDCKSFENSARPIRRGLALHHWLGELALTAYRDHPKSLRLPVNARLPTEGVVTVDAIVKYDDRGLPVEAFGRSEDGKAWARLTVVYRSPTREELGFEFPWLDPDKPLPRLLPQSELCKRLAAGEQKEVSAPTAPPRSELEGRESR